MSGDKIIEIKDLRKMYGTKEVLKGINLEINKGEIIGYIGPNGAGKSTTVKIILGLVEGYSGEVVLFGQDIKNSKGEYKKKIGYVPEVAELYDSLTAKEYLLFIAQLYGLDTEIAFEKVKVLMELLGIVDYINTRLSSYSKGMKQKVLLISQPFT